MTVPSTRAALEERITVVAAELGVTVTRVRTMLVSLVVSQKLPESMLVKGGMGIKLRVGEVGTRATKDLDVVERERSAAADETLRRELAKGWGSVPPSKAALKKDASSPARTAFTATIRKLTAHMI